MEDKPRLSESCSALIGQMSAVIGRPLTEAL